jgi:hypothetical protein
MSLSYITPREKKILSPEFQLVGIFFCVTICMLVITYIFLGLKIHQFGRDVMSIKQTKEKLISEIAAVNHKMEIINVKSAKAQEIVTHNAVMQESIKNLFDLVPDRILLSQVDITKNSLILYGTTPNKEIYEFMLQAPLRSIFDKTSTSFYQLDNGSLRFVSQNYLTQDKL